MIFDIIRNGFTAANLVPLLARVFVLFCVLPVHEFAHALVAYRLGDKTAKLAGRLTLNPLAHLDLFGTLMILLVGFGYAKPVPVNPRSFKNQKGGMAVVAAAGPLSNLLMAVLYLLVWRLIAKFAPDQTVSLDNIWYLLYLFCYAVAQVNVMLAVFNLLPIPPLDGSRIWALFLPDRAYYKLVEYERYIVIGVFALLLFGILDIPLSWLTTKVMAGLVKMVTLPFGG